MSRRPSAVRMAASELSEPYIGTTTATMRARSYELHQLTQIAAGKPTHLHW